MIGLGRGLEPQYFSPDGGGSSQEKVRYYPSVHTRQRIQAIGNFYNQHWRIVERVVCSGGYPAKQSAPPPDQREGSWMADFLRKSGLPANLLRVENTSTSTFENFIHSIEAGYLRPGEIDENRPLGIVASLQHFRRARLIAQYALDAPREAVRLVRSVEGLGDTVQEAAGLVATKAAFAEVNARPGNLDDVQAAAAAFEYFAAKPVQLLWPQRAIAAIS